MPKKPTVNTPDVAPFDWKPHIVTEVDTFTKQRTGYVGRAVCLCQNGMEFIVMAKDEEQVDLVCQNFLGIQIDTKRVYMATMIASEGVTLQAREDSAADLPAENVEQAAEAQAELPLAQTEDPHDVSDL